MTRSLPAIEAVRLRRKATFRRYPLSGEKKEGLTRLRTVATIFTIFPLTSAITGSNGRKLYLSKVNKTMEFIMSNEEKNKPVAKVFWNGVEGSVWNNGTDSDPRYNTTFQRSYTNAEGKRESTSSFSTSDLGNLVIAANMVAVEIQKLRAKNYEEGKSHAERVESDGRGAASRAA
jgi:hypothetical protein